jgi:hypothetical protein
MLSHCGRLFKPAWPMEMVFYERIEELCSLIVPFLPRFYSIAVMVLPSEDAVGQDIREKPSWGQQCRNRHGDKVNLLHDQYLCECSLVRHALANIFSEFLRI